MTMRKHIEALRETAQELADLMAAIEAKGTLRKSQAAMAMSKARRLHTGVRTMLLTVDKQWKQR